jgi:EKC/KEOPS complex subunit CGI121/TPRKB
VQLNSSTAPAIAEIDQTMALLQSINLEHIPTSHTVHIALYRDIRNASFLHQQLLAGNTDFEYALIDASVVSTPSIPFYSCPRSCPPQILL